VIAAQELDGVLGDLSEVRSNTNLYGYAAGLITAGHLAGALPDRSAARLVVPGETAPTSPGKGEPV
jgi:hypothetical protein